LIELERERGIVYVDGRARGRLVHVRLISRREYGRGQPAPAHIARDVAAASNESAGQY
jgi:hypothetical protein